MTRHTGTLLLSALGPSPGESSTSENLGGAHDLLSAHQKKPRTNTRTPAGFACRRAMPVYREQGALASHPTQTVAFFTQIGLVPVKAGCTCCLGISVAIPDPRSSASVATSSPALHHTTPGGAIWGGGEWGGGGGACLRVYAFYFSNSFILFSHPEQYERSSK